MLEQAVGVAVIVGVVIKAAEFWMRWLRKPSVGGEQ
jgi:hypothetical protein